MNPFIHQLLFGVGIVVIHAQRILRRVEDAPPATAVDFLVFATASLVGHLLSGRL